MKKTLFIFILICSVAMVGKCNAQKKINNDTTIHLSKLEKNKLDFYYRAVKDFEKIQQEHFKFLEEFIISNGINPSMVSLHPDSLKIVDDKMILRLRKTIKRVR